MAVVRVAARVAASKGGGEGSTRGDGGSHTHAESYTHVERWRATRERR